MTKIDFKASICEVHYVKIFVNLHCKIQILELAYLSIFSNLKTSKLQNYSLP